MLRKMNYLIFLIILISNNLYADDSVYLDKDQKAPFSGYLLTQEKVQQLRNDSIDNDTNKKLNDSLKTSLALEKSTSELKDNKINLLLQQNDTLAKSAYDSREMSNWEKAGYFFAGIILTGAAIKGVQALK